VCKPYMEACALISQVAIGIIQLIFGLSWGLQSFKRFKDHTYVFAKRDRSIQMSQQRQPFTCNQECPQPRKHPKPANLRLLYLHIIVVVVVPSMCRQQPVPKGMSILAQQLLVSTWSRVGIG